MPLISWKDLRNLDYLYKEIEYLEYKIDNYKPAEIVIDSVRGSSATFPYVEHTFKIEGLEQKNDRLTDYINRLKESREELHKERTRIEEQIELIPFSEIRMIIRYKYLERKTYVQIMHIMGYNTEETPRKKLERYIGGK